MIGKLLQPEVRELIASGDRSTLSEVVNDWLPADLASLVVELPEDEQAEVFQAVRGELAASTFEHLDLATQERLLESLPESDLAAILNGMSPDDRTALLEEIPEERADELLRLLSTEERVVAESLLDYPEDSIGRLMTPDYIAVKPEWTVKHVLDHIRSYGKDSETLDVLYIVDEKNKLIDDIRIREFLLSQLHTSVRDIMDNQFVSLKVTDAQETAISVFRKYDRTVLPVVGEQGTLVGIVTVDDVLDVVEEEATEDIQKFGGMEALDEPYISTSLWSMVKKRATWLVVLFVGEMFTASAMQFFDKELEKAVVLAMFIPLIISSGGNSGSQAATLIIRALALGEVRLRDWWVVMRREIFAGLILGTILGTIGFLRIAVWSRFSDVYGQYWALIGLTVGITLIGIVLWGTISGAMLPFILKRLGLDPATSSAPFVATLVDVTGLVIYFTVALLLLSGTLL